ncbi:type II secretion system secretin GspD [Kordiimonas sp. SCSIO 12603]|uniref:type II secretion system secretin GspD n=1 Tax=Kordiimonas sp. SCSIO 12603 TaxID=2829596 RepID=UPI002102DED5|nr:type II secretion system secretin GspD [Kordiimonas sp. SCSIO 12603]UTW58731.1 type II secretion system secretin GspD [Kordiimonas sp. SCSIO 12603]
MYILRKTFVVILSVMVIAGCSAGQKEALLKEKMRHGLRIQTGTVVDTKQNNETGNDQSKSTKEEVAYYDGSGIFTNRDALSRTLEIDQSGSVSLTFKNTDIRIIIQAILTELNQKYTIDPRVQGNATLETSEGISKLALRDALEALLKTRGYALVQVSDGYHVLPISEAPQRVEQLQQGRPASANLPGFSVHIVPLKYTSALEMRQLLEPFSAPGNILRADNQRNLLILAGTSQEIRSMLRTIEVFDVDWMAGMSFAIFPLQYVEAEQLVKELAEIFSSDTQNEARGVRFIPIPRINKVLALAPKRRMLEGVEFWVEKLDLGGSAPGRRIYVYQVKNGRAVDMSRTLNQILGTGFGLNGGGSQQFDQANNFSRNVQQRGRNTPRNTLNGGNVSDNALGQEGIRIVPNDENNSIVIMATPTEFGVVEAALRQIDLPPKQVLIEVTLADVTLTDELRYGLQWHFEFGDNTVNLGQAQGAASTTSNDFSWTYTSGSNASAVLNAIESLTDVKVISSPKLLVLNNQSATLQVGDEVPVPVTSAVSTNNQNAPVVNSIQYRSTGVILTVTPRINEGGLVMVDVEQEVSSVVETETSGIDAPTIQQRRLSSSVAIQNGATVALGGLIRTSLTNNKSGVPILKDIPVLGAAFSDRDIVERRSELVVLLTPRIIQNSAQTEEVMDYLQKEFRSLLAPDEPPTDEE